jgi:hypothetical protein
MSPIPLAGGALLSISGVIEKKIVIQIKSTFVSFAISHNPLFEGAYLSDTNS